MRLFAYRRFPVAFLFIWLVIIFVAVTYFMSKGPQCDGYANELEAVKLQVRQLAEMNDRLQELVRKNNAKKHTQDDSKDKAVPKDKVFNNQDISSDNLQQQQTISYEREKVRRRIANGAKEVWYFINAQLKKMLADNNELRFKIDDILSYVMNQTHALQIDTQVLGDINGLKEIRHQKLTHLKQMLIQRLDNLQNPADCSKSRRLLCKLNKGCGYGCQMHHAVYCLIVAYATKRTLLLDTNGWRYMPRNGWNGYYKPLSPSCSVTSEGQATQWDGHQDSDLVVYLPISDSITRRPPYLPLAVPKDMSETLLTHHGHPFVWFVGHMMRYLLRWQPTTTNFLEDKKKTLKFEHPIVGIHVRRTDKINSEAALHTIDEYMIHVEEYYQKMKRTSKVPVKRVFIATDEPAVVAEAKKKYKDYVFISDSQASKSAALNSRYSDESLRGVILDIELLAQSDYLVCTFSSQVCRLAYEIMQTYHDDASQYFHSLDDIYYFGGQNMHRHRAIYPHAARGSGEINLEVGDIIAVAGNHWDGYSKGRVQGKGYDGLYPSYKTEDVPDVADFAAYD